MNADNHKSLSYNAHVRFIYEFYLNNNAIYFLKYIYFI